MHDQGIAWMIAGGVRTESREDRHMRMHRIAIAESAPSRTEAWQSFRLRIAAAIGGRAVERTDRSPFAIDCCAA